MIILNNKFSRSEILGNEMNRIKINEDRNPCETTLNQKRSSLCIDKNLQNLRQDNTNLIETIRKNYIYPPSQLDYNLTYAATPYNFRDDKLFSGQYGEASSIEKKILEVLWFYVFLKYITNIIDYRKLNSKMYAYLKH